MKIHTWFCEFEDQHEVNGEHVSGCMTYPVIITTDSSASSHGQPVVLIERQPRGVADMPSGELHIPTEHEALAEQLRRIGYRVCYPSVNDDWLDAWHNAETVDHWHPDARLVQF